MDAVVGFEERITELSKSIDGPDVGRKLNSLTRDVFGDLFEKQYRYKLRVSNQAIQSVFEAILDRYPTPRNREQTEEMVHHVLYVLAILNEWPVGIQMEYDQRIRLTRRW